MFYRRRKRVLWLIALLVAAVSGWFCGRSLNRSNGEGRQPVGHGINAMPGQSFAAGSPEGLWIARVKQASSNNFAKLLEECRALFPENDDGTEGRRERALRWILAMWLVADPEGGMRAILDPNNQDQFLGSQVLAQILPERAVELLGGPRRCEFDEYFASSLARELAEAHPEVYLRLDPNGTFEVRPGRCEYDNWERAITNLAKTDAQAAADACVLWKAENAPSTLAQAMLAVARACKTSDRSLADWVNGIAEPKLRNVAMHARLCALAEKDPKAALAELYVTKLEDADWIDAPRTVLTNLAKQDVVAALKLVNDVEGMFALNPQEPVDPFEDRSVTTAGDSLAGEKNPFEHLSPIHYSSNPEVPKNGVRLAVLAAAAESLPDDPAQLVAELRKLNAGIGDAAWQRGIESDVIGLKSSRWSVDECMAAAGQWAAERNATGDDVTLQELAKRMAAADAEQALAALPEFPEQVRSFLAGEIIKRLRDSDSAQRLELIGQLSAADWNEELGTTLGRDADHYAAIIAGLSPDTSGGVLRGFVSQWTELDPDAAVQWLQSLPDDETTQSAMDALAYRWASYDADAATAWADDLPDGPAKDHVAMGISDCLSGRHHDDAWQWADRISDTKMRAKAFDRVAIYWRSKAPDDFRAAHAQARKEAGLPAYKYPTKEEDDPFQ